MLERLFDWDVVGWVVALAVPLAFGFVALVDFKLARVFFFIGAAYAMGGVAMWGAKNNLSSLSKGLVVFVVGGIISILLFLAMKYVETKELASKPESTPSLVFIFGVPLGDNNSATWMMMLTHYGPNPAFSCSVDLYDDDRKNIEHQWLVANPNSPYPPPGLAAGESQKHSYILEAGQRAR